MYIKEEVKKPHPYKKLFFLFVSLYETTTGAVGNEAFAHQVSLRSLNLSHNVIANIDMAAFKGLTQLQKLDLSYNKISRLSERLFQGSAMNLNRSY